MLFDIKPPKKMSGQQRITPMAMRRKRFTLQYANDKKSLR